MRPSLGIAIPSFRQVSFVRETLGSLQQLTTPFEAIIRDAGSDDGTIETIEDAIQGDDRFRLLVTPGESQSVAINEAWSELVDRHALATWINTDDVYLHAPYDRMIERMAPGGAAAMFGDFEMIDAAGATLGEVRRPGRVRRAMLVHYYNAMPGFGVAIRSDVLRSVGFMRPDFDYAMDLDLWLRVSQCGPLVRHPETVVRYRWHDGAKTVAHAIRSRAEVRQIQRDAGAHGPRHELARVGWRALGRAMRASGRWVEVET